MCEKCVEIDKMIAKYRSMALSVTDQAPIDAIRCLIERGEAEKKTLRPEDPN